MDPQRPNNKAPTRPKNPQLHPTPNIIQISKSISLQILPKQTANKTKLSQVKLLTFLVRRMLNRKIGYALEKIKKMDKPDGKILGFVIQRTIGHNLRFCFSEIRKYRIESQLTVLKPKIQRINTRIFLVMQITKKYERSIRYSFNKLKQNKKQLESRKYFLNQLLASNQQIVKMVNKKQAMMKIISKILCVKQTNLKIVQFQKHCKQYLIQNLKYSFNLIFTCSAHQTYQSLFNASQGKRKLFYDQENSKRQFLASQRQNIYNLKQLIDNEAYQRSVKQGEKKRQRTLKINQAQQKLLNLQRQLQAKKVQFQKIERIFEKLNLITVQRQSISTNQKSSVQVIQKIFNTIKYVQPPASRSQSQTLLRQKFTPQLKQFQAIKNTIPSYTVYQNIQLRQMICLYQGVPINNDESKFSQEYQIALQENAGLKGNVSCLIGYQLLRNRGDSVLKQESSQLAGMLDRAVLDLGNQRNNKQDIGLRDSVTSIKYQRQMKKSSNLKTSTLSNKF